MILGLQITGFIFAVLMIYMALLHFKKGSLTGFELTIWVTVWFLVIIAVIFPELLRTYAAAFAVSRLFDLLVVGAFILIITMVSLSYVRVKRLEKKLEDLVRKLSLKEK